MWACCNCSKVHQWKEVQEGMTWKIPETFLTLLMREVKRRVYVAHTLVSFYIFRLSLSSVSLVTLPGKDPLQPLKEAQGKASHCHRIPDQNPVSHWLTAWGERKSPERAAVFVSAANTAALPRGSHNTSFVIPFLSSPTDVIPGMKGMALYHPVPTHRQKEVNASQ